MALERVVDRQHVAGAVVAASVVGDGVEIAEPAGDAGEAARPVEGPVDEDHQGRVGVGHVGHVLGQVQLVVGGHSGQPRRVAGHRARARPGSAPSGGTYPRMHTSGRQIVHC